MAYYTGSNLTDLQSARTAENLSVREASLRRALAAMQAMSEVGRQSSAERIAGGTAANEATRLQNLMTLGREQYGSNERVAGLNNANAETIAGLERASRLELGQLPFSQEAREHALAVARLGVRPDPYMTRDIGQANIESIAMNDLAKSIAESVNLTIDREEAELLKDLPGPDWWNKEAKIKDGLTKIITGLDAKLGENRQLLEFVPATNRYKPRVRAIIPIPNGQSGPTPNGSPAVPPPRQNHRMMDDSVPLPVPQSYGPTSGSFSPPMGTPMGTNAAPVVPPIATAVDSANSVPQMLPTNPYLMQMSRGLDWAGPMTAPARGVIDAVTYLPRGAIENPTVANALQKLQELGSAALGGTVGRIGIRPENGATGSVAVPTAPTNAIAADLAKLATLGPVPPGTTSTNRATGMTYQFNGSTWQPMPR